VYAAVKRHITNKQESALLDKRKALGSAAGTPPLQGALYTGGMREKSDNAGRRSRPKVTANGIGRSRKLYFTSSKYHLPGSLTGTHKEAPLRYFNKGVTALLTTSA
jgi:hypothetical protein